MLENENTPQVGVLQGVKQMVDVALISTYKDNENVGKMQLIDAKKFATEHLLNNVGMNIQNQGYNHNRVDTDTEAFFCEMFERYITGCDGDKIRYYFYADSRSSVRVFNGRYYEHWHKEQLEMLIKEVLRQSNVGRVYKMNSPKKIADEVLKELWYGANKWSPDSRYFTFANGVLNIDTMQLLDFNEQYVTNNVFEVDFSKEAKCDTFRKCLNDALGEEEQRLFQEACGYLLFPDCRHEVMTCLVGNGRNGKSALLNAISYALGEKRVTHYTLQQMTDPKGLYIANSMGAIANISNDSGNVIKVGSEALFKSMISGEALMYKILNEQPSMTTNYPKSLIAVNELPQSADFSDGFYRRFQIIKFDRQIPPDKVDVNLREKLERESVGILLWIIEGYKRLLANGKFSSCESSQKAVEAFRENSDPVATFIREDSWEKSDKKMELSGLYNLFSEWLQRNGHCKMSSKKFGERLRNLGFKVDKSTGNKTYVWAVKVTYPSDSVTNSEEKLPIYESYNDEDMPF